MKSGEISSQSFPGMIDAIHVSMYIIVYLKCMFGVYIKWSYCENRRIVGSLGQKQTVCWQILLKNMFSQCDLSIFGAIFIFCKYGWMIIGRCWNFYRICSCDVLGKTTSLAKPEYSSFDFGKKNTPWKIHHTIFNLYIFIYIYIHSPRKLRYPLKIGGWKMKCQFGMSYL